MNKLQAIQKGSEIIDQIFLELVKILKTSKNLTELDLARRIKKLGKTMNAPQMAFPPIVAFGPNASEIHHEPTNKLIGRSNFLMLDYGVKIHGFCSDFTRTLFIGNPNQLEKKIYNLVLKSQLAAIEKIKPKVSAGLIDNIARGIIDRAGYKKSFLHTTGHGLGEKIHQKPRLGPNSKHILAPGSIVTVEPGIYLPGKFGVRIEDMILVSHKPKIFSKIPKDFKSMIISR